MSSLRLPIASVVAALLSLAWTVWVETSMPAAARASDRLQTTAISEQTVSSDALIDDEANEPLIDTYGNEVERAVTEYRIDYRGDVYERHSPQTALPRLPPPGA